MHKLSTDYLLVLPKLFPFLPTTRAQQLASSYSLDMQKRHHDILTFIHEDYLYLCYDRREHLPFMLLRLKSGRNPSRSKILVAFSAA